MNTLVTVEYEGTIISFQDDGWFNATVAAAKYGKRPHDWLRLPETVRYIDALTKRTEAGKSRFGKTTKRTEVRKSHFVKTSYGGVTGKSRNGFSQQGTWLHPKLAVRYASWLDMDFSIWCDEQIDNILRSNYAVEQVDDSGLSTVRERFPLYFAAFHGMLRHRLSLPVVYRAINEAAGSTRFRFMTKRQVNTVVPVAQRIASGTATPEDWKLLDGNRKALDGGESAQMDLINDKTE